MTQQTQPLNRRRFIRLGVEASVGIAAVGLASRITTGAIYVRPPGTASDFDAACIRCGACVEVCPEKALKQLDLGLDFKNIGTPILSPENGGCKIWGTSPHNRTQHQANCTACMDACPSGALHITDFKQEKPIGIARIQAANCINCMYCFQVCPIHGALRFPNPEGIDFYRDEEIPLLLKYRNSELKPYIDTQHCLGCGRCQAICPPKTIAVSPAK